MNRRRWMQIAAAAPFAARVGLAATGSARPSPEQLAWQDMELSMFVHFGPATWQNREYDDLSTPLDQINPAKLDTEQWADVAQSLGARQIVFVAKHTGGFCWWQTATSKYSVRGTPWRNGKGDVMADLAASCRKRSLRLGVYLSPQDRSLAVGLGGKSDYPAKQAAYSAIYRQQLTELLSKYGDISEVWFDGSSVVDVGDLLSRYAPHAIIFQSPYATIRWVGNEDGVAPDPNWNAVTRAVARSGVATSKDGTPDGDTWLPCEVDARIHDTWFWNTEADQHLKSVDRLMSIYYRSVGHGALLLLNNTPDTTGLIPDLHAKRTSEFGAEIKRRFSKPIAQTHGTSETLELKLPGPTRIDHVVLMEDIAKGQHVRSYALFGLAGHDWHELARGSSIGHKKIDAFPPVEVSRVILRAPEHGDGQNIRLMAAYSVGQAASGGALENITYQVIYDWKPASFDSGHTTWDIDLTPFVKDAGQYDVQFIVTGGGIVIKSLTLVAEGNTHDEYVTRVRDRHYRLNIPGLGTTLDLRVVAAPDPTDPAFGQVVLSRAV
jgi:alpha-L-fucosidase